jgi:hypothetical protein
MDATRSDERQLQQLQQLQVQQLKEWELKQKLWQLQQELNQQQRLQQAQHAVLVKAERGQGNSGVVKEERRQATVCKPIEYVDANGVTRLSYTDESCDEQVMHWSGGVLPSPHWDPELEARSRQMFQFNETNRLLWLQDQENRKADQQQGNTNTLDLKFKR